MNALLPKSGMSQTGAADAAMPGKRTLVEGLATGDDGVIDQRLVEIGNELLRLGVKSTRIGDLSRVNITSSTRDLHLLAWIAEGKGRRGAENRIVSAWNAGQDGLDNRAKWATILNYVHWLDAMSVTSMGMSYEKALAAMPTVRLAGAGVGGKLPVHPRAVYFCAAAQVGMDVRAGIEEGKGHYIPVGGFKNLLKDLKSTLKHVGTHEAFPGAVAVVTSVRGELTKMIDVLAAQEAGVPYGVYRPEEHLEPDLRRKLVPLRDPIAEVGIPTTDVEATSVAAQLAGILGVAIPDMKTLQRNHGSGSVDPHGPGHAMGMAVDMFYGAGEGKYGHQNKGVKSAAWPFIYLLIAEKGPLVGLSPKLRPASLGQLAPDQARQLSELLHGHGATFLEEVKQRERSTEDTAQDRRTYHRFRGLRRKAMHLLIGREHALQKARKKFPSGHAIRAEIVAEMRRLHADRVRLETQDPESLPLTLHLCLLRLTTLELSMDLQMEKKAPDLDGLELRGEEMTGKLFDVIRELQAIREEAQPVVEAMREQAAVDSAKDPYTRKLVERAAQDDRLLFDQPTVMVEALNEVRTGESALQASHHWVVAPMEILESPKAYGDALRSDMTLRHIEREPPQLERVLSVMAESDGGRDILTAPQPRTAGIAEFHAALADVVGGEEVATSMIARVAKKVIGPYESGGKLAELRDRGFYLAEDEGEGSLEP